MKIVTVVGARPQSIKAATVFRAIPLGENVLSVFEQDYSPGAEGAPDGDGQAAGRGGQFLLSITGRR